MKTLNLISGIAQNKKTAYSPNRFSQRLPSGQSPYEKMMLNLATPLVHFRLGLSAHYFDNYTNHCDHAKQNKETTSLPHCYGQLHLELSWTGNHL